MKTTTTVTTILNKAIREEATKPMIEVSRELELKFGWDEDFPELKTPILEAGTDLLIKSADGVYQYASINPETFEVEIHEKYSDVQIGSVIVKTTTSI